MTETVYVRFRLRGRTAADWTSGNEVLLDREMGVESDTRKFKFGDGTTAWNSLAYASADLTGALLTSQLDTDTSLAANSDTRVASQKAVRTYVNQIVAAQDAMVFKGVIDCSANPNYPAADRGWTYRASVAGKIGGGSGVVVQVGDIILCLTDSTASGNQATVGANWSIIQCNIDGALTTADIGVVVQAYSSTLLSLASASANGVSLVTAANYAAMRTLLSLGSAALANTGTSGATVPLLDGSGNAWTNGQSMPSVSFTGGSSVPIARRRRFGYGASYNALVLGGQANTSVAFVDVDAITGGNFAADGNELIIANNWKLTAVNPAGTDFLYRVMSFPSGTYRGLAFTVAGLPAAATVGDAARAYVTDATATTFASVVAGGGSNKVPVYSDGTDWRIG